MKIDKFKMYLFFKLKEYQTDLKISDIEIINDDNEKLVEKYQKENEDLVQENLAE